MANDKKKRREEEERLAKAHYVSDDVRMKAEEPRRVVRNYGIKPLYQRIDERKQQARMLGRDMRSEQNAFMRDAMAGGIQAAHENQQKRQTQRDMDMAIELIRTGKMDLPATDQMSEVVKPGYGYKRAGNQAVYATPNSPLPDPKKAKTATRAQAPGAFGISPQQYKDGMQAIREQEAFGKRERPAATKDTMANEGARNFLDKWFPEKGNELPTQDEMLKKWAQVEPYQQDLYWMDYQNVSGAIDEHRMSAEEGAAAYDEEKIRRQADFDDAIRLLGEDAPLYANETEADQLGRFAHTYGMGDAAKKYAQEYKVPGLFENYDAHDAEMYMIMHPEQKEKLSQYAGTENETGYSILHREMTQDQKDIYMALAAVHGEEAAQDWLRSLLRDKGYNERAYWTRDEALREYANEHPVLATGKSFLNVPLQISGVGYTVGQALKGEKIDPFDFAFAPTQAVQTPRDEVSQMITRNYGTVGEDGQMKDNLLSWLMKAGYSATTSGGDSIIAAGLGMGIPGAGAAIQGVLGASGQIQDASMRGADTVDALLKGGVSAVIETATEYLPMEHFIKTMDSGDIRTVKDVLVNALKGGLTEAPGEGASELLGYISDELIMGEMSNWDALVAEKGVEGAAAQVAWDVFNGAFVGFLSGTGTSTMAGTKAAVQNALTENPEAATPDVQKPAPEAPAVEQTEEQEPAQQDYWEPEAEPDVDESVLRQEREVAVRRPEAEQTSEEEQQDYWELEAEPDVDKSVLRQEREVTGRRPKEEQAAEDATETPAAPAEEAEQPAQEQQGEEQQAEEKEPAKAPENAKTGNPLRQERAVTVRRNKNEQQMTVTGVEAVNNGSVFLNVRNADGETETVAAGDVEFEDPALNELLAYKNIGAFTTRGVRNYLENYDPKIASTQQYQMAFRNVYEDGYAGLEYMRKHDTDAYLTRQAMTEAFTAGVAAYNQANEELARTGGVVRKYSADAWRLLDGERKKRARANLELADALGKRMARKITVVDRVTDNDGNEVNGRYNPKTGEIEVALNADAEAYAYVAMHELTHAIKAEHKDAWHDFENFVADALERSGQDLADLVDEQMSRYGLDPEAAMEEVICNTVPALLKDEQNLLSLYKGNRTLFERVMDWVRSFLDDIKASGDILAKGSRDWKQMDALKQNREDMQTILQMMENIMSGSKAEEQTINMLDEAQLEQVVVKGEASNVMETPVDANGAEVKYSRSTYEQSMAKDMNERKAKSLGIPYEVRTVGANQRKAVYATGRDVTEAVMKKENISQKVIDKALGYVDKVSKWFESAVGKYEFVNLQDVNDASIMIDHNTGKIVFSCMVPNAEYKVNFDFTTVCRQREAVQRFVDDLAKTPGKNGETKLDEISLTPENIFKLNTILKDEGYETACLGCFVEAKRYRIKDQADTLVKEWNDLVLAKNPNAEYFDFATGETDLFKMSTEEISKLEANMRNYNTKGTSRATERAERLVEVPEMQKLLRPGDFISRQGRKAIREFSPALESFLVSRFGQGGAKPAVGFMPYNSEVALLPDTKSVKGKRMTLQQYLAGMGGARSNSFSDFLASHAMDYLQRTVDLAARNLTAQCYTKVPGRALLFGRMGEKVNMSVMFDIDPKLHWSMAGLDANGEYIVGDKARAQRVQEETGVRPFTQSFPWEQAVEIEHDERYAENCGIIGVGYSYNHMAKMMEDDNVPYIIGYHRSNLPENVAKASNTSHATNYEPVQNTTRLNGYAKVRNMDEANGVPSYATWPEGKKKTVKSDMTWDMQAAMKRNDGNATKTLTEWLAWMKENDLTPMTSAGEAGHGAFDLYGSLEKTMDPARTAEEYASYCLKKGMLPVFYEFMDIDGYDKVLFDFSVRNLATGEVAPQRPVSLDFLDDMTAEEFTSILENEMGEHNEYNRKQFGSEKWERVKSQAHEQLKFSRKGLDANIDEELEHARDAFELVRHSHRITAAEADQLAGKILKEAQSTYDRTTLAGEIAEIMDYIERADTVNMDHVDEMETSLMARVMEQSRVLDEEHEQLVDPIRQYFKGTHIKMTETQIKEAANLAGSYAAYRRQVMGRVKLSKNTGTELDVAWEELNEINPEWFPLDAAEGDMPEMLLQVVDAMKPAYNTVTNLEETASWLAGKLNEAYFALPAVKAGAKNKTQLGTSVKEMRQAMTRFAEASGETFGEALKQLEKTRKKNKDASDQEAWNELRRQWNEWKAKDANEREERFQMDLQKAKDRLKANDLAMRAVYAKVMAEAYKRQRQKDMAEMREREALKKQRARTEATVRTLMNWLEKPTDAKHVPASLDEPLKNALLALDFGGKDTKVAKGLSERLEQLATAVEQAQERENDERTMFLERDQQMVDELRRVAQLIKGNTEGRGVYDLNSMELKELNKWLGAIRHTILQASKMHGTNLGDVQQVAAESIQEIAGKKPMKDKKWITKQWESLFGPDMMDSFTFFERLGPTSTRVFNELRKGFDKTTQLIRDAEKHTKEILKDVDLKKLSGKKAEKLKVDVRGRTVEMTRANIMELYVLNKRDQARGHIYKGGFRIKGDEDAHPLLVKEEDVAKITDLLTDEEKRIADAMQEYLSKECAAWGNETSMKLLGYEKFGEESYWPIMTDSNERNTTKLEENFAANIAAIKNQGMTKQLIEGASNAIIIGDIFDTYTQHISNMSAYAGYAVPLSDMQRWINSRGVKTEIEHVMGAKGKQYINNFLMAVNGTAARQPMTGVEKLAKTAARNAKTAAVGGNIRVIVQQPTSYARAAMYMSPKYLMEALAAKKPDAELVNKYCSIAAWKRYGFYETNVGPGMREMIVGDTGAVNKLRDIMMEPAAAGDNWTLNHLWAACELETADIYPELEKGSDEYYQKVGERMSEIIDRTQVVDSPFHRSQIMRSKSWMAQTLTNFMSEPTKTFNMLTSAIYAYADNRKNPAARARVARALGVWAATSVLTAAAAGIVDAFRDDDEEKKWLEKYGDAVLGNTMDGMNPLGMLPGVKDALSIIQGYDPSRIDQQSIQRIYWAYQEIAKYLNGTSKMNLYGVTYKVAQALSSTTGIPLSNVMRDLNAVAQSVTGINLTLNDKARKNQTIDGLYDTMTEAGKAKTTKEKDAAKKKIDEARAKLTKIGMNPKEIDTALAERLAEDPRIKAAWEAKQAHKVGDVNRTKNALAHEGFTGEMVDKAIAEYGKTAEPKEEKGKDMNAQLKAKLFTQDEAVAAIRAGASNEDIEYMMSELVSDSSAKDPEKSVRDGLKAEVKKDYLEAVKKGDRSKADRSRDILTSVLKVPEADLTKWEQEQHADDLRLAIDAYNSVSAAKAVAVMRADGKSDSDIKGSLGKYRQMYIDAVRNKDSRTANKIKSLLLGLGLMGKNGKPLYTEETFADWVK